MLKITYKLLMLTTLPMTMQFNVLSQPSLPEYIEQLTSAENPNEVLHKIDSHPDRRKDLSKLGVTKNHQAALVHHLYMSAKNKNTKQCINNVFNLDGSFKNLSIKENIDQYMDALHSCLEQGETPFEDHLNTLNPSSAEQGETIIDQHHFDTYHSCTESSETETKPETQD